MRFIYGRSRKSAHRGPTYLELRAVREKARQGGGEKRILAQHAKGKLTAREAPGSFAGPRDIQ